jgi:hypothetical protein
MLHSRQNAAANTTFCLILFSWWICVLGYLSYLVYDSTAANKDDRVCPHYNMLTNLSILVQVYGITCIGFNHINNYDREFEIICIFVLNAMLSAVYVTFFVVLIFDTDLLPEYLDGIKVNVFVVANNVVHVLPLIVLRECVLLRFGEYSEVAQAQTSSLMSIGTAFWIKAVLFFWAVILGIHLTGGAARADIWTCYKIADSRMGLLYGICFFAVGIFANATLNWALLASPQNKS